MPRRNRRPQRPSERQIPEVEQRFVTEDTEKMARNLVRRGLAPLEILESPVGLRMQMGAMQADAVSRPTPWRGTRTPARVGTAEEVSATRDTLNRSPLGVR